MNTIGVKELVDNLKGIDTTLGLIGNKGTILGIQTLESPLPLVRPMLKNLLLGTTHTTLERKMKSTNL